MISIDLLKDYIDNIFNYFGNKAQSAIQLIEEYQNLNELPKNLSGIYRYHPNLKIKYFEEINTKKKAYWLGWLYAEAWLSKHDNNIRFGV